MGERALRSVLLVVFVTALVASGCGSISNAGLEMTAGAVDPFTIPDGDGELHTTTRNIGIGLYYEITVQNAPRVSVTERMETYTDTEVLYRTYPNIITGFQGSNDGQKRYQASPMGVLALRYHDPGAYMSSAREMGCRFEDGSFCAVTLGNNSQRPFVVL